MRSGALPGPPETTASRMVTITPPRRGVAGPTPTRTTLLFDCRRSGLHTCIPQTHTAHGIGIEVRRDRGLDHRRMPDPAGDREGRQGCARRVAPSGARRHGAPGAGRAQRTRHLRRRRRRVGHLHAGRLPGWRPRPHGRPRCGLCHHRQRRHPRPLLRIRHLVGQLRRRLDPVGHGGRGHRRRDRDDVVLRRQRGPVAVAVPRQRERPPACHPSADEPGRRRRRHRDAGEDRPPRRRRAGGGVAAPGRDRHRGGALRQVPGSGAQPRRVDRARPGGVPPPRDHRRLAGLPPALVRGAGRHPPRRRGNDLPLPGPAEVPRARDRPRPPRRQLVGRRRRRGGAAHDEPRTTPPPTGCGPGPGSSPRRTSATTRP